MGFANRSLIVLASLAAFGLVSLLTLSPPRNARTAPESPEKVGANSPRLADPQGGSSLGHSNPEASGEEAIEDRQLAVEEAKHAEQLRSLLARLGDRDPKERAVAAERLAAYPNPATESALIRVLKGDPQPVVRNAAVRSLASFEDPSTETWRVLLDSLLDSSPEVQASSVEVLRAFLSGLKGTDPRMNWVRQEVRSIQGSPKIAAPTLSALQTVFHGEETPGQ